MVACVYPHVVRQQDLNDTLGDPYQIWRGNKVLSPINKLSHKMPTLIFLHFTIGFPKVVIHYIVEH